MLSVILIILFLLVVVAAPIVFVQARKVFREQKNYERGLKIVPLLIHLPPLSEDTEVGTRDVRDVTDETISKATIIYNIVAGTLKTGFRSTFYGQRHFAFEIVGSQGFVYFYAAVPISLVEVVKQAINSAYPTARLEEVSEHNIFNPVGRISGTLGGELTLKENYAYPIATYQDLKRDGMQSLLNALSGLGKEDGAGIQILLRPANPAWRKNANALASKKRKGNKGLKADLSEFPRALAIALFKVPEYKEGEDKSPELSSLDQATLDAIDEKTRHPGFEVVIRLVVSSNVTQRAQAILGNIVASFSLYDAPGKNGFKYAPAKDIDALTTAYILRLFPQQHNRNILNAVELATLFHFPDERAIPTSQLTRQESKQVDGPRNIPEEGLLLGYNLFRGAKKPIRLGLSDRQRHMYVVGQTGTGKSTYMENLALQDMLNGNGFAFVDPHGDVVDRLLAMVPKERTEDVIYFSPAEMDYPIGLNLFEYNSPDQIDFLIQETLNMLQKLYDPQHQGIMGPRYEHIFRNAALAVMADPDGGTFVDIPKLFRDPAFLKQKLQHVRDQNVLDYWQKEYPASQRSNDAGEITAWFVSKFGAFLSNEMMRNIIGQTKSAFDLRNIMDNKKILLVNLSKGRTGELNSKLLGMVFVMKFQAAAMSRADVPEDQRPDFSLYVDEFQNFSTDSFATIMSEARKYHLNLIVANQFTTQLTQEIRDAVFGNMGTIVAFRIGQNDIESIVKYFQPTFDGDDLLRVPNFNTIVRTMIGGVPTQPFSMATLPSLGTPNPRLAQALKQLSAAKYGKPKAAVEQEINARMTVKDEVPVGLRAASTAPPSAFGTDSSPSSPSSSDRPAASPQVNQSAPPPPGSGSFLDEWLAKRQTGAISSPTSVTAGAPNPIALGTPIIKQQERVALTEPPATDGLASAWQPFEPSQVMPSQVAPTQTQNISSNQLEQNEVDRIAAELKQQLDTPVSSVEPTAKRPAESAAEVSAEPVEKSTIPEEPVFEVHPDEGDTIFIDREGSFRRTDPKVVDQPAES